MLQGTDKSERIEGEVFPRKRNAKSCKFSFLTVFTVIFLNFWKHLL